MLNSIGLLLLRLGIGTLLMTHGWGKVEMVLAGEFDKFPDPLGMGQTASLVCAALSEFGGGLLVVIGLLTRFGALSAAFTLGVAAFVIHGKDPLLMGGSGASKEPAILFLIPMAALVFTGAGALSLDAKFWSGRKRKGSAASSTGKPAERVDEFEFEETAPVDRDPNPRPE